MWRELLVREARYRAEVFRNLDKHLRRLVEVVKSMDPEAEVYLFGSAAEGKALLASDIDVLVVTSLRPSMVMARLWLSGFKEPFEIHVAGREEAELYKKRARLLRLG